jgi:RHS repeat-associated protein
MKVGGQYYFYQNDHLGTPQKLTAVNGAVVWSAKYSSFGEADVDPSSILTNNLRFAGQYFDEETELHYNYFRYYDPEVGRYLKADPIGLRGGINVFAYGLNNPINLVDILGLESSIYPTLEDRREEIRRQAERDYEYTKYINDQYYSELQYAANYSSGEAHLVIGAGVAQVGCCDENNVNWKFVYLKSCFGLAAGVSGGGGIVTGMDGKGCRPENYEGWFYEVGGAIYLGAEVAFGIEDDSQEFTDGFTDVNTVGGSIAPKVGFIGKASWCVYNLISSSNEGSCGCGG